MKNIEGLVRWLSLLIFFTAKVASAQNPTVAVILGQDLSFGTVPTNTTDVVAASDPGAGTFQVQYYTNANKTGVLSLTFALPNNLRSGSNALPITFGANSAAYNFTNSLSGSTSFDPSQGLSNITVQPRTSYVMYVWIGGTVGPGVGQAAGTYTGTITVTANFEVGNKLVSSTQSVSVTATVIQGLSLSSSGALNFGPIVAGTTPPSLDARTNVSAPLFMASGAPAKEIAVSYSASTSLSDGYGHTLTFAPSVCGSILQTNQTGSSSVTLGSTITLSSGSTGYYYFWIGGGLGAIPTGQASGIYSGTFTLSISYY